VGKLFSYSFRQTINSKLQWLQFRINNNILTTNSCLSKIGKIDLRLCPLCKNSNETIFYLLWDSPKVQDLIHSFPTLCNIKKYQYNIASKIIHLWNIYLSRNKYYLLNYESYIYKKRYIVYMYTNGILGATFWSKSLCLTCRRDIHIRG
jgi:hypothetical protein